ncbi:MAG: hypothetical protein ABI763_00805, partial [Bacteroidota bacterium]
MKNFFTKIFCIVILNLIPWTVYSQDSGIKFNFSQPPGTMLFNNSSVGAVSIIPGGSDDQLASFTPPTTWSGFYFGGVWYPQDSTVFYVSSNGWLSIQKPGDAIPPSSLPINNLSSNPFRIIAPLWDDLKVHNDGEVTYKITGVAAARGLVFEWRGMYWDHNGTDTAISFQAILYDNAYSSMARRNTIEFRYKRNGSDMDYVNNSAGGASIGISGFCASDIYAFTNVSGQPSKTIPEISDLSSKPPDGSTYRLNPGTHSNDDCANAQVVNFISLNYPLFSSPGTTLNSTQSL